MAQAFEELIGHHLDDLYSAAICFTLDEHRAEQLLQEASIRAFHELSTGPSDRDFRRAMLEILVSTYLQRRRRQRRDPLAHDVPPPLGELLDDDHHQRFAPFPAAGTPGYRMLVEWLTRTWAELDDGDRLILWLADVERMRHTRLAALTGLSERQVRARHYRARLTLSREAARELGRREAEGSGS